MRSPMRVRPTIDVRISAPLPTRPGFSWACSAAAASIAAPTGPSARLVRENTELVWLPTSFEPLAQSRNRRAISSSESSVLRSVPVAATSAMHTAIEVSSLYSAGAKPNGPPPFISGVNSESVAAGLAEKYAGCPVVGEIRHGDRLNFLFVRVTIISNGHKYKNVRGV